MEATTLGSLSGDALIFWVGSTILHEFVHYGDDGTNSNVEEGVLFEEDAYGQNVTRTNAVEILLEGSSNY